MHTGQRQRSRAFTLIELLVVISIIAVLIGLVLPALAGVRKESRAVFCASNLRSVGQAMTAYTASSGVFPPSYVYGDAPTGGGWRMADQGGSNPAPLNGLVHWSYNLVGIGESQVPDRAFQCPSTPKGGAPASNPGADSQDWDSELAQVNDLGSSTPSEPPRNRQARRMAYTANGALVARNKFSASSLRRNILVSESKVSFPVKTILATEFVHVGNWSTVFSGSESKSHRPVIPFVGADTGGNVYDQPDGGSREAFEYPPESALLPRASLGPDMIGYSRAMINAVGRSHPGSDKFIGGTANFVFVDGHVDRMSVRDSLTKKLWGDRFYSLTGQNTRVRMSP
jgi:prepilin-type N-terminal cleavage/methylation domain-containing protein/prepilin-type processing-associated H-X9-DG protein